MSFPRRHSLIVHAFIIAPQQALPASLLLVASLLLHAYEFCGADGVEEDEAMARRLQEQEDALATRGRATRGALRVPQKPSQAVQKGPSRDARHARGSASAGVRSSSRLKPPPAQGKQRPVTRGSTGTHALCVCVCACACVYTHPASLHLLDT